MTMLHCYRDEYDALYGSISTESRNSYYYSITNQVSLNSIKSTIHSLAALLH